MSALSGCGGGSKSTPAVREGGYGDNRLAEQMYTRAENYFANGRYDDAISEYQQYIDEFGDIYYGDEASLRIAEALEKLDQWREAALQYESVVKHYKKSQHASDCLLKAAQLYQLVRDPNKSVDVYILIIQNYWPTPERRVAIEQVRDLLAKHPDSKWAQDKLKQLEELIRKKSKE